MKKKVNVLLIILTFICFITLSNEADAATTSDHTTFDNTQYNATMQVSGSTEISFIKTDGSVIDWDNPLLMSDGNTFGMTASFQLSNINEIIDRIANGEIDTIPETQRSFIQTLKREALISGSFELKIDLNEGLGDYFSVNQTALDAVIADPNSLFGSNTAYSSIFNITSVSEANNIITISVSVKDGVTGGNVIDLATQFESLDFTVADLFTLNSALWDDVDEINRGEFEKLVEVYAPEGETIFIVNIPSKYVFLASLVGARNPYVGVKLEMDPGYGALNLGFVLIYEGNGNTSGTAPVDSVGPYNNGASATLLGKGTLKKDGYKFIGWSTDQTYVAGTSTLYQENETYLMAKNTILYAQWEEVGFGSVVTQYVDQDGNELSASETQTGTVGDEYTTTAATIEDYVLDTTKLPSNASGTFTSETITVTYVYKKNTASTVTTKYVDQDGNELADPLTQTGIVGDPYTTQAIAIEGYELDTSKLPSNASGNYASDSITVTYVYTKKSVTTGTDETNKSLPNSGERLSTWIIAFGLVVISAVGYLVYNKSNAVHF